MALTIAGAGSVQSKSADVTIASTSIGANAGDTLFLLWAGDVGGSAFSASDNAGGNTWTEESGSPVTFAAHVELRLFRSKLATSIISGVNTVTISWTTNITAKAFVAIKETSGNLQNAGNDVHNGGTGTSGAPNSGNVTTTQASELIIGGCGVETADAAPTQDTDYTTPQAHIGTSGGGGASNIYVFDGSRIITATETNNYAPTIASASWACGIWTFKETVAATFPDKDWFDLRPQPDRSPARMIPYDA